MNKIIWLFILIYSMSNLYGQIENQKITLNEAVETALKNNPNLTVYEYEIESLEKQKLQAGLIPNPEVGFEAENCLCGKDLSV